MTTFGESNRKESVVAGSTPFSDALGRLVQQLRATRGDQASVRKLVTEVTALVAREPVVEEAGIQLAGMLNDTSLRGRMHARQVDVIRVAHGAPAEELLALAQALAQEDGPIPSTEAVRVELVQSIRPGAAEAITPRAVAKAPDPPLVEEPGFQFLPLVEDDQPRRPRLAEGLSAKMAEVTAALTAACAQSSWMEAIHAAQALIQMAPRIPEPESRSFAIQVKRLLPKPTLDSFISFAIRAPEEQQRVADILPWGGRDALEAMIESIQQTESVEARAFLHDAIVETPGALRQVLPLLNHEKASVVRLGAELLARLADSEALPSLLALLDDPSPDIRAAGLHALAAFADARAVEALRQGLQHASPDTRGQAALAIAASERPGLGMPLMVALEGERDETAWGMMACALGRLGTREAVTALATVALEKKGILKRGYSRAQRLEAVSVLADCGSAAARGALESVGRQAEGEVAAAARQALAARGPGSSRGADG